MGISPITPPDVTLLAGPLVYRTGSCFPAVSCRNDGETSGLWGIGDALAHYRIIIHNQYPGQPRGHAYSQPYILRDFQLPSKCWPTPLGSRQQLIAAIISLPGWRQMVQERPIHSALSRDAGPRKVRCFGDHSVDTRVAVASESSVTVLEGAAPKLTRDEITSLEVRWGRRA